MASVAFRTYRAFQDERRAAGAGGGGKGSAGKGGVGEGGEGKGGREAGGGWSSGGGRHFAARQAAEEGENGRGEAGVNGCGEAGAGGAAGKLPRESCAAEGGAGGRTGAEEPPPMPDSFMAFASSFLPGGKGKGAERAGCGGAKPTQSSGGRGGEEAGGEDGAGRGGDGVSGGWDGGSAPGERAAFLMMESMWRVSLMDIESTLRRVSRGPVGWEGAGLPYSVGEGVCSSCVPVLVLHAVTLPLVPGRALRVPCARTTTRASSGPIRRSADSGSARLYQDQAAGCNGLTLSAASTGSSIRRVHLSSTASPPLLSVQVCNKLLADRASEPSVRRARARGLVVMGRVFQAHGSYAAMTKLDVQVRLGWRLDVGVGERIGFVSRMSVSLGEGESTHTTAPWPFHPRNGT